MARGTLGQVGEHDWLKVTLVANQAYRFQVTGLTQYALLAVGDAASLDGGTLAIATTPTLFGAATAVDRVWFTPATSGTYYIDISDSQTIGPYAVTAVALANDFPATPATTGVVTPGGVARTATLGVLGEHDWLKATLTANQAYLFTITGLSNFAQVAVGDASSMSPVSYGVTDVRSVATPTTNYVWFTPDTTGTYFVDVSDPGTIGGYAVSAVAVANDHAGNATTTGTVTPGGATTTGVLAQKGEHDWLKLTLTANQAYEFTVTGLTQYAALSVGTAAALDEGLLARQVLANPFGASAATGHVWFTPTASGTYYIDLADPATIGGYAVSAVAVANDFTNNTTTTGTVAVGGATTGGTLGQQGEQDWLKVTLTANQAYLFSISGLTQYAILGAGTAAALSDNAVAGQSSPQFGAIPTANSIWFTPATSGTYYVGISDGSTIGAYTVAAAAVANDFAGSTATTGSLAVGGAATAGMLGQKGEHDWLKVTLAANQAYEFTVTGLSQYAYLQVGSATALAGENLGTLKTPTDTFGASPTTAHVWFTPDASGTYYLDISDAATIGAYSASVAAVANDFPNKVITSGTVTVGGSTPDSMDFDGSGTSDVLFQNGSGQLAAWSVTNGVATASTGLGAPGAGWSLAGTGSLYGTGNTDLLFRHSGGTVAAWRMQDGHVAASNVVGTTSAAWTIIGTGNLHGTGTDDVLFKDAAGHIAQWTVQNGHAVGSSMVGTLASGWSVAAIGNLGGSTDSILFISTGGTLAAWSVTNGVATASRVIGTTSAYWSVVGVADVTGDGQNDIVFRGAGNEIVAWTMNAGSVSGAVSIGTTSAAWRIEGLGDYNADGTADILFRNTGTGALATWMLSGGHVSSTSNVGNGGTAWQVAPTHAGVTLPS